MKKRILSMILAIVMVVGLMPGMTLTASAAYTGSPVLKTSIVSQETPDDVTLTYEFQSSSWYPTAGTTYKLYADTNKTTEAGSVVLTDGTTPTLEVTLNEVPVRDTRYYLAATAPNSDESKFTSIVVKTYRIADDFVFSYDEYSDIEYIDFFQDQTTYDIVLPPATATNAPISVAFETANGATVTYSGDTALTNGAGSVTATVVSDTPALSYTYTVNFTTMNLSGQGTQADPYLLTSAADLQQLAACLNNYGAAPMDIDGCGYGNFCGYYFKLTNNIDLSGIEWEPIGHSGSTYFAGHFDGDNHTVSNMTTSGRTSPGEDGTDCSRFNAAGLFGWCAFGSIKNVTVDNADVTAIGQNEMGYAGGLIAVPFGCSVINCHVKNSTIESGRVPTTNSNFAGGVAGMAAAATFEECSSVNNTVRGTMYVGGFIGSQEGESNYTDCYVADTTIESVMVSSSFNCNVGGFASASQDGDYVMTNCFVYDCKTQVADGANTNQYEEGVLNKYEWDSDIALTTNCYYYTTQTYEDGTAATAVAKTPEEFADGTVLAALNGDRTGEDVVWMQGESYPVFAIPSYTVTVAASPTEGGTITGGGEYEEGTTVTLTATANKGYTFVNWAENGSEVSADESFTFTASGDRNLTAVFEEVQLITLNLESPRGLKETLEININGTVADLKAAVAEKCGVTFGEGSEYRLFGEDLSYPNSKLDDDTKVLKDIGFADGQTIHLEKSTNWDASSEPIKIFGLTITGGKGSQEPYGDYSNVDYYWNYYHKTIIIKSTAAITISGTGEPNTNIIIKNAGNSKYTNLTISDLSLTTDAGACINVQSDSWVKLTVKGNNTLTATGEAAQYTVDKMPALTLTNSGAYLKIMKASNGTLTATTNIAGQPGIGTYDNTSDVWGVEINGGTIIATGGEGGAGIRAQAVCIYGGDVTANGGIDGYGANALYPYSIEILGGTVTASSESGKALSVAPNLDSYMYYTATASTNKDGTGAVSYDAAANDTYKYFKIEPRAVFTVSVDPAIENGTVVADKTVAAEGETVTLTVTPAEGNKVDTVKYNDTVITPVNGVYSFTMPANSVTVTATYASLLPGKVVVNGVDLVNGEDDHAIDCGGGTAVYDPDTKTLTLTNAEITIPSPGGRKAGVYFDAFTGTDTVTINIVGENSITLTDSSNDNNGIWNDSSADLKITGTGSLDVLTYNDSCPFGIWNQKSDLSIENAELTFSLASGSASNGFLVDTKAITLDGAKLTASGYLQGLSAPDSLTIENQSEVDITAIENALFSESVITIEGSTVEAETTDYAAICGWDDITIENSTVTAHSDWDSAIYSFGLLTISGGKVQATTDEADALNAFGGITIKDNAEVTAEGLGAGIFTNEILTIESGKLTAKGGSWAILARKLSNSAENSRPTESAEAITLGTNMVELSGATVKTDDWAYTEVWDDGEYDWVNRWMSRSYFVDGSGNRTIEANIVSGYNVEYKAGANGTGDNTSAIKIPGTVLTLKDAIFTRTHYTQTGWATTDGGEKAYDLGAEYTTEANAALYPVWTANTYTVKFDANGGSGTMVDQLFSYDAAQNLSANTYTYTNKHFNGWNTAADGSGTAYTNEQSVSNLIAENNGIVTLYAQWSDKSAQAITFDTTNRTATYGDGPLKARTATAEGTITYSSSDESVATVDANGVVTVLKAGEVTITASVAETDDYAAGSASYKLTISKKELTITVANKSVYVGSQKPDLGAAVFGTDYTVSGLVGDDTVTVALSYVTEPDMNKAGEYAITATGTDASGNYTFSVLDGKLTVKHYPYIPSVPSTPPATEVTVPISGDDNTIHVDAEVKGDKATIDHVDLEHLDTVIGVHVEEIGTVIIDFSVLDKPITTVEIPSGVVKEVAAAVADPTNDAESLKIILTDGTSIEFDAEALGEKAAQADGLDITISIEHHEDVKITHAQKNAVGDRPAYDINVTSGGKHISDMGGKVTVHAPYELKRGEKANGIVVYYVDDYGNRERCETIYDPVKQRVNWKTDHLSLYMIDYDEALAESCDGVTNCPSTAFSDLDTSLWYHEANDYVLENGLMNGIGGDKFDPNGATSRAMIVTILWRLEGEPVVNYLMQFEDVPAEIWYTEAVRWAASEKIVEGWDGKFDPMGEITREQFATILWRYAKYKGYDVSVGEDTNILSYEDAFSVSEYAIPAMQWACGAGLMQGDGVNLTPKADATRAQAAALFQRFCENVAEK